jgi:hypothetical protein
MPIVVGHAHWVTRANRGPEVRSQARLGEHVPLAILEL